MASLTGDEETQTRLLRLAGNARENGLLTGSASVVELRGATVRRADKGDLAAAGELVIALQKLSKGLGDFHVTYERAYDKYVLGHATYETKLQDVADSLSGWCHTAAFEDVLNTLSAAGAAKLLLDAAEAKKQAPAKPEVLADWNPAGEAKGMQFFGVHRGEFRREYLGTWVTDEGDDDV